MANHGMVMVDDGEVFQIVPSTRKIIVPTANKIIGTVGDHNSEQITFSCPKLIDGHDVEHCMYHYVIWRNAAGEISRDVISSITSDEEHIYFTWVISSAVTKVSGTISFAVVFEDVEGGATVYSWSTTPCDECQILDTIMEANTGDSGNTDPDTPVQVPDGYVKPTGIIGIMQNGQYNVTNHKIANVTVPQLQAKEFTTTKNGVFTPNEGDAYTRVTVTVPDPDLQSKDVTENGEITPDSGYYGLSKVTVNVQPNLQEKTATGNGEVVPDDGFDGLLRVTVAIPEDVPTYQNKTVTENGTVTADAGYDALASVTVNVPDPELHAKTVEPTDELQTIRPDSGFYGLKYVEVKAIPSEYVVPSSTLTIKKNGTENVKMYEKVTVEVPSDMKPEEEKTVDLNFLVEGVLSNMAVNPESGKVFSKVVILKPNTLIPSNIKKGVTIAGVVGTYVGFEGKERMYIGGSTYAQVSTTDVTGFTNFDPVTGTYSITTTKTGYIYICIPSNKLITSIVEDNFELLKDGISLQNYKVQIDGLSYVVYRTDMRQIAGDCNFTITLE